MTDLINVGKNAISVTKADVHVPYTKVIVIVGTEVVDDETVVKQYEAGTDDGLALEFECPWGSQDMADKLLAKISPQGGDSLAYKPYTVSSGMLDPSAEIGDGVNTNGVFGGLYTQNTTFGHGFYSDYSAPEDEQMNHEYKYETATERRITRQENSTKALFKVANDRINARVEQTGGNPSSFGWELLSTGFVLKSGNNEVFRCDANGLKVTGDGTFTGTITAKKGIIGASESGTGGFIIKENYITSNSSKTSYDSTTTGVFIGTTGIGLGQNKFTVKSDGTLKATGATITGSITCTSFSCSGNASVNGSYITGGTITRDQITTSNASAITTNNISNSAVTSGKTSSGVQTSLARGNAAKDRLDDIEAGSAVVGYLKTKYLFVCVGNTPYQATWKSGLDVVTSVDFTNKTVKRAGIAGYLGNTNI